MLDNCSNSCQYKSAAVATCRGKLLSFHFRAETHMTKHTQQRVAFVMQLKKMTGLIILFSFLSFLYLNVLLIKSSKCPFDSHHLSSFNIHSFISCPFLFPLFLCLHYSCPHSFISHPSFLPAIST